MGIVGPSAAVNHSTYALPNFVGELFGVSTEDTPLLSAIGGLTGGESTNGNVEFTWQSYDLRDASATRQKLEGQDVSAFESRTRTNGSNILEIHQEAVAVTYTKQAASNQVTATTVLGSNPVQDELSWQLQQSFKQVARDVEATFISGTYQKPDDNTDERRTRGLLEAIVTNVVDADGPLTAELVLDLMQEAWENGGLMESETRTLIVGAAAKRALTKLFVSDKGYEEATRNVGGVNLQTIETDFGRCNIMLDRYMPSTDVVAVSLEELAPVFLEIPGKGHFFAEPLAKTGATDKVMLYGEIGLKYGNERKHGKITGVAAGGSAS